jgi:CBS domain-containing protein
MADLTTDYRPPIGLFGSFITEKDGDHANQLDLKKSCLTPLNNIIRLFGFEYNIAETSTSERIDVLSTVHPTVKAAGDDLAHAFEFISLLRIRHQLERVSMDLKPDNFINPKKLNSLEQRNLKEICKMISGLLNDIEKKYCMGAQL